MIGNRFCIEDPERDLLGRGEMGEAYHAMDMQTGESAWVPITLRARSKFVKQSLPFAVITTLSSIRTPPQPGRQIPGSMVKAGFVIVDEDRSRDMHGLYLAFRIATTSYRPRWLILLEEHGSPGIAEIWLSAIAGSAQRPQPGFPGA